MPEVTSSENRRQVAHGLAWITLFQGFQTLLSFGTMLVLVRVIPPSEYGRATAAVGWLLLMGSFGCVQFMNHALQLPRGEEPDWSLHWTVGVYIQGALCVVSQIVAGLCWLVPSYRPIAPLLHIAGLGVLFECGNRLRGTMLRRAMDFRRLRIVHAIGSAISIGMALTFGLRSVRIIRPTRHYFVRLSFGWRLQAWRILASMVLSCHASCTARSGSPLIR